MTKVIDVQRTSREDSATPAEIVGKLIALDWYIVEERPEATVLNHELIPGASRIVLNEGWESGKPTE
jgi:hypothetical protein